MLARTHWRVRYYETDQLGVVYHSHYFQWFEIGRAEALRGHDASYKAWEEAGVHLPLIACACQFKAPAHYDDLLTIETSLARATRSRLTFEYRILHGETGRLLATGSTEHVFVNREGRPTRLDRYPHLRMQLERMQQAESFVQ